MARDRLAITTLQAFLPYARDTFNLTIASTSGIRAYFMFHIILVVKFSTSQEGYTEHLSIPSMLFYILNSNSAEYHFIFKLRLPE